MDREAWKALSLEGAVRIQEELRPGIIPHVPEGSGSFETVAGIDLAYWEKGTEEYAVCCIVVLERESGKVLEHQYASGKVEVPYIPGCLAFRELPLILETVEKLEKAPDLYLFDGNGYLHPRRMGIATHASFYLHRPTIGIAKKYYKIDGAVFTMPPNEKNAYTDIRVGNEVCGRALRTAKDVKPVFLSVGNYMDLDTATKLACSLVRKESHIPLPTRLADLETHRMRRELNSE